MVDYIIKTEAMLMALRHTNESSDCLKIAIDLKGLTDMFNSFLDMCDL